MAPKKKMKTYRRSNANIVNNSVDAINVLFGAKPKRVINMKRKKRENLIKELLSRPKCVSYLTNDSFQKSFDDTFDKLFKKSYKDPASKIIHNSTVNLSKSLNKSEIVRFIPTDITIHSPILTRQRKNFLDSSNSLKISDMTNSYSDSLLKRLKEPSEENIESSLEIERIKNKDKDFSSLSYIKVPNKVDSFKIPNTINCSKLGVSIDNFSKSLQGKLLTHCSTPVSEFKHPSLINQSKEESSMFMESNMLQTNYVNKTDESRTSKSLESQSCTPKKRDSFIILRKRKVLKGGNQSVRNKSQRKHETSTLHSSIDISNQSTNLESFSDSENQERAFSKYQESLSDIEKKGHFLTTSLDSFSKFENKIASYISSKQDISKGFKSFDHLLSPVNFVTKRRAFCEATFESNCGTFDLEENKELETKKLVVELERLPFSLMQSSASSLESSFEQFYSQNISKELGDTELENKTDKSLENFEQFYASNYLCSQNSEPCVDISLITLRKKSVSDDDSLDTSKKDAAINLSRKSINEFEKFYLSHYSFTDSKADSINDIPDIAVASKELVDNSLKLSNDTQEDCDDINKKITKELKVNITRESLRTRTKNISHLEESNNIEREINDNMAKTKVKQSAQLSTNNGEVIDLTNDTLEKTVNITNGSENNRSLRIMLTRNSFNDLMTTNNSKNKIECNTSNNKSTIDLILKSLQVGNKSHDVGIKNLMLDVSQIENFEMFYKDNYDIYDYPLPTVEVKVPEETSLNLTKEKSLDVIESSYTESPLFDKSKNKTKKSLKSMTSRQNTKSERLQAISVVTPIKSKENGTPISQNLVNNFCDILNRSTVSSNIFKMPKSPLIQLKGGKSWKRSMSIYRNSISGFSKEDGRNSYLAKTCPKGKLSRLANQRCSRKLSICLVPVNLENPTQNSIVDYALNNSYVPDQIIEGSLEDSFRCLSLNHVNTLNKTRLDQVPITAKDVVLRKCGQTEPLEFSKCFPDSILTHCHKIGEGVFGEVFLFRNPKGGTSVIKIVPVEGDLIVNGERQKKFEEVLSEIIITMELSNLRNNKRNGIPSFTEVQKIQCVQGKYPEKLVFLWDEFDETRGSENDCPDIFRNDQLYIVFQMAYGGKDLESFEFNNAVQAYSMFQQVAIGLAVAEEELQFEHRDLHWGNVLISTVEANKIASFTLNNRKHELPTMGVEVAIIDFTLSRIEHNGVVIFNDLSMDPDLFVAEGDYQFDIYRLMQDKNRNNWKDFEPFTNLLWLHYILGKAVVALRYKNVKSKRHREYIHKLKMLKDDVLRYHNVKEFVSAKLLEI